MEDRTRDSRSGWGAVGKGTVSTFDLDGVRLHAEKSLRLLCYYFPPAFTSHTPATGLKAWYLDTNGDAFADVTQTFGFARDAAVVGAWKTLASVVIEPPTGVSNPIAARPAVPNPKSPETSAPANPTRTVPSSPAKVTEPDRIELSFANDSKGKPQILFDPAKGIKDSLGKPVYFRANVAIDELRGRATNNVEKVKVNLYWAVGPRKQDRIGLAATEVVSVSHRERKAGDVISVYFRDLQNRQPARGAYLVGEIDPDGWLLPQNIEQNRKDNVAAVPVQTAGDLARLIRTFTSPSIKLATVHVSGKKDTATSLDNIRDVADDLPARRSRYTDNTGTGPGGSTELDSRMLNAMLQLSKQFSFGVSEIAGGVHSSGSGHYKGLAFDINVLNGKPADKNNAFVQAFIDRAVELGAVANKVRRPGNPGHDSHVHLEWSDVRQLVLV